MNYIVSHRRWTPALRRGIRNGVLAPGYLYTRRMINLGDAGSIERAWREIGELLNEATEAEGERLGQKARGEKSGDTRTGKTLQRTPSR